MQDMISTDELRQADKVLVLTPKEKNHPEDIGIDKRTVQVKVRLSLRFIKHYSMKAYGESRFGPHTLNLGFKWK